MPGQFVGFPDSVYNPFLVEGDPSRPDYRPLSLSLPDGISASRIETRLSLMRQLHSAVRLLESELNTRYDHLKKTAYDLVVSSTIRKTVNLNDEPESLRNLYGRNQIRQSLLVARRLAEAGVQFVGFNEFDQTWDTHSGLETRYKNKSFPRWNLLLLL